MQKNVASQKLIVYAFDSTTNLPKTGDGTNITAYVSKDYGTVTVLNDTTATEMDSTNAKGYYLFDLLQAETSADTLMFSAKSATGNIVVVAVPPVVFTTAPNFNKTVIDASGLSDANMVKMGPSGSGTAQTAKDLGTLLTTALTESYAAKNASPTVAQALCMILQHLTEFSIATTTWTTKKLDQSTSAATYQLNDATNPTAMTRLT